MFEISLICVTQLYEVYQTWRMGRDSNAWIIIAGFRTAAAQHGDMSRTHIFSSIRIPR